MHQWHAVHPAEVDKLDVLNTGREIHAFALRVDASLAMGEVANKVSRQVSAGVFDSLELDDSGSKLQEAGRVVHQLPCT